MGHNESRSPQDGDHHCWHEIQKDLLAAFGLEALKDLHCAEIDEIKKIWQNLRTTYRKKKYETKGKSGAGAAEVEIHPKWKFYQQMRFLDTRMPMLPTHSSLAISQEFTPAEEEVRTGGEHQVIIENVASENIIYAPDWDQNAQSASEYVQGLQAVVGGADHATIGQHPDQVGS